MTSLIIRPARLPDEEATLVAFISALQHVEHDIELNRRVDASVGAEYFVVLRKRVAENEGRIFVAQEEGRLLGWMVSVVEDDQIYIIEHERRSPFVVELFVIEEARGRGIGSALLRAAEADFRARGYGHMMIGVLSQNIPAVRTYENFGFEPYVQIRRKRL